MEAMTYIVEKIDGEYAHLKRTDQPQNDLKLVARALLPPEIMEGTKLVQNFLEYTIAEE